MNQILQKFKEWVYIGLWFLFTIWLWGIIFAAWTWSTTSPTSITWDTSLFSNAWNTLTAAKWNEVVNKINNISTTVPQWTNVDLNDTTTTYDKWCLRRWERVNNADSCSWTTWWLRNVDLVSRDLTWLYYVEWVNNYKVSYTNKKYMCQWWSPTACLRKICKLEKLCQN